MLIASKQIYANHYFNAFTRIDRIRECSGCEPGSVSGLREPFASRRARRSFQQDQTRVVEKKAVEGLRAILEHSKLSLEGQPVSATTAEFSSYQSHGWGQRLFGGVRPLLWLLVISAFIALVVLGRRRSRTAQRKPLKPESVKS